MNRTQRMAVMASVVVALAGVGRSANAQSAAPLPAKWIQDRFIVGLWVPPPVDERADERYRELADAGFNLVIGGPDRLEDIKRQLDACEKAGLGAFVSVHKRKVENLAPDHPALRGYLWWDEPTVVAFAELSQDVSQVRESHPGKPLLINLLPNYAAPGQLGAPSYDAYISTFVDTVKPEILSMDHYPRFRPGEPDGRDAYCENLASMRTHSLRAGIPFWNFFNTMPYGPHTDPTEAQLRWQITASLAYGAKGVMYFCYCTPGGDEFPKGGAIIGRDDRRTRHYEQARRLNAELAAMGPALMRLTSTRTVRIAPAVDPAPALAGGPILNLSGAPDDPKPDYLVGEFEHADGRRAVLLQNYQFAYSAWPTVTFDAPPEVVLEIDKSTGREAPLHDDSPDIQGIQVSLDAGEGRLFLLPGGRGK